MSTDSQDNQDQDIMNKSFSYIQTIFQEQGVSSKLSSWMAQWKQKKAEWKIHF